MYILALRRVFAGLRAPLSSLRLSRSEPGGTRRNQASRVCVCTYVVRARGLPDVAAHFHIQ